MFSTRLNTDSKKTALTVTKCLQVQEQPTANKTNVLSTSVSKVAQANDEVSARRQQEHAILLRMATSTEWEGKKNGSPPFKTRRPSDTHWFVLSRASLRKHIKEPATNSYFFMCEVIC